LGTVTCEHAEDCSVDLGEAWTLVLALQHEELVPEGKDLRVSCITGREEPPKPHEHEEDKATQQVHESQTSRAGPLP